MDLRQLGFFVRIVESGSFSRAAKSLNVAQPSLSQRIKDLERELGVDLLHRSPTGVKPTDVGTIVADRARSILKQVDHLKTEVRGQAATPTGNVTVGLPTTMALHLTVPLVQQVREKLPGINLHVTEGIEAISKSGSSQAASTSPFYTAPTRYQVWSSNFCLPRTSI